MMKLLCRARLLLFGSIIEAMLCLFTAMQDAFAAPKMSIQQPSGIPLVAHTVVGWNQNRGPMLDQAISPDGLIDVHSIASGSVQSMALQNDATVAGWGEGPIGSTNSLPRPNRAKPVAAGTVHTAPKKSEGSAIRRQSGGSSIEQPATGLTDATSLVANDDHALHAGGSTLDFGNQAAIDSTATRTFNINNSGDTALRALQASAAGHNSIGTGQLVPDIAVFLGSIDPSNELASQTGFIYFSDSEVAGEPKSLSFTILNRGPEDLSNLSLKLAGNNPTDFLITPLSISTLSPGNAITFKVTFAPITRGYRYAVIYIFSDDPDSNPFQIGVFGHGLQPKLVVEQPAGRLVSSSGTVVAWGLHSELANSLFGIKAIAPGSAHLIALRYDGRVIAAGDNSYGQAIVPNGLLGVQAIAAGTYHNIALQTDGTTVAWGLNNFGQATPPSDLTGVKAVSAGTSHSLALKTDGRVVAWGDNSFNQSAVPSSLAGVKAIAAGGFHSVALRNDGTVMSWGDNSYGQTTLPDGLSGVEAIAAGLGYTVALKADGTVIAWGNNDYGQSTVPVGLIGVHAIAAGITTTLALKNDGTVVAWGGNFFGQTNVPAGLVNVYAISAAADSGWALTESTSVFTNQSIATTSVPKIFRIKNTGDAVLRITEIGLFDGDSDEFTVNSAGTLTNVPPAGQTTLSVLFTPKSLGPKRTNLRILNNDGHGGIFIVRVTGTGSLAPEIAVYTGADTTTDNEVTYATGRYALADTVVGNQSPSLSFIIKNNGASTLTDISISLEGGNPKDFLIEGLNSTTLNPGATATILFYFTPTARGPRSGLIKINSNDPDERLFEIYVTGLGLAPEIAIEYPDGVPITTSGLVMWGGNNGGQLNFPTNLMNIKKVVAGSYHTVALHFDGTITGWGNNAYTQLEVPAGITNVQAVAAGDHHTVAVKDDGTVVAWGLDPNGETSVPEGLADVTEAAAGWFHTLALKRDGTVVGWGDNSFGQARPPDDLSGVVAVAAGAHHSLALKLDGTVVAWGRDESGQATVPVGLVDVQAIAAGETHSVALTYDGSVIAWGGNIYGQSNIPEGLGNVRAIASSANHTLALRVDGSVVGWGASPFAETIPPPGLVGVQSLSAGLYHSVALVRKTTPLEFGQLFVPASSSPKVLTIKNNGVGELNLYRVEIVGKNAADFALDTTSLSNSVAPANQSTTLSITFTPSDAGIRRATLRVWSNDGGGPSVDIDLMGTGIMIPDIGVFTGDSTANSDEWRNNVSTNIFDSIDTGEKTAVHIFTIKNLGNTNLIGISLSMAGKNPGDFLIGSLGRTNLAPSETATFSATFAPKLGGPRSAIIKIFSNDPDENPFLLNVSGIGLTPDISIAAPGVGTPLVTAGSVVAWGSNAYGQTNVPGGSMGVIAIASGYGHTLALKVDGSIVASKYNLFGQSSIPPGLTDIRAISAGRDHSLALKGDGTVSAWGGNYFGQLRIPAALTNVVSVATFGDHNLALKQDGTVVAWGEGSSGQLRIPIGLTNVHAIAAGVGHSVAARIDGSVVAWGSNTSGEITIPTGLTDVQAVAAGFAHTIALRRDGTVVAWGHNGYGQTNVPIGLRGVQAIAAGWYHSVALKSDGTVVCWGRDVEGQTSVPADLTDVRAIAANNNQTVALRAVPVFFGAPPVGASGSIMHLTIRNDGDSTLTIDDIRIMGRDAAEFAVDIPDALPKSLPATTGQTQIGIVFTPSGLGVRTATLRVLSNDPDEGIFDIALTGTGASRSEIAVFNGASTDANDERSDNQGLDVFSGTGVGKRGSVRTYTIKNVGSEDLTGLALRLTGPSPNDFTLESIESNTLAPNATTTFGVAFAPTARGTREAKVEISSSDTDENPFEINVTGTGLAPEIRIEQPPGTPLNRGRLVAWGRNDFGQINIPQGLPSIRAIAAGDRHTVVLTSEGTVVAWGDNRAGQATVPKGLHGVRAVAAGAVHTVVLNQDGTVTCWGDNSVGQTTVPESLSDVRAITAGYLHTVALRNDGTVVAWGGNAYGQTDVPPEFSDIRAISAGQFATLALRKDGTITGWNNNSYGQLNAPSGATNIFAIASGYTHALALGNDGKVFAWGANSFGQASVPKTLAGVSAIAAGYENSAALMNDGSVVTWGVNLTPLTLPPTGLTNVQIISAGGAHAVAGCGSTVAFGQQIIGTTSVTKSFRIRNAGGSVLNIANVSITGASTTAFILEREALVTLLPPSTGEAAFVVSFTPTTTGLATANLRVVSDDAIDGIFDISLTGIGVTRGDITVLGDGVTIFDGASLPNSLDRTDFGAIPTGFGAVTRTFTIRNPGTTNLIVDSLRLDGSNPADFAISKAAGSLVAPMGSTAFEITFGPKASGFRTAVVRIAINGNPANLFRFSIQGTGINSVPVAGADTFTRMDQTKTLKLFPSMLLANDTDSDGDPLNLSAVSNPQPTGATVVFDEGVVTYTTPTGKAGDGSFEYTLTDGPGGHIVTGTVNIVEIPTTLDLAPKLRPPEIRSGEFKLEFVGVPGHSYVFQYSADIDSPDSWRDLIPVRNVAPGDGVVSRHELIQDLSQRFYRVVLLP